MGGFQKKSNRGQQATGRKLSEFSELDDDGKKEYMREAKKRSRSTPNNNSKTVPPSTPPRSSSQVSSTRSVGRPLGEVAMTPNSLNDRKKQLTSNKRKADKLSDM